MVWKNVRRSATAAGAVELEAATGGPTDGMSVWASADEGLTNGSDVVDWGAMILEFIVIVVSLVMWPRVERRL